MTSDFLKNLQKTVETGEFNSEAAQAVTEQEAAALNGAYEEKMANIKKQDGINAQIAVLVDIEDMVKASIDDMFGFTEELEEKFKKEFESEDPMFGELYQKIENLKSQYHKLEI